MCSSRNEKPPPHDSGGLSLAADRIRTFDNQFQAFVIVNNSGIVLTGLNTSLALRHIETSFLVTPGGLGRVLGRIPKRRNRGTYCRTRVSIIRRVRFVVTSLPFSGRKYKRFTLKM